MNAILSPALLVIITLFVLFGCSQNNEDPPQAHKTTPGGIAVPPQITTQLANMPAGEMFAYVSVNGGERQAMAISDDGTTASLVIDNLAPGQHDVAIVFEFVRESETQAIGLANTTFPVNLDPGNNKPGYNTIDYTLPDNDEDNISNIDELVRGSDPYVPNRKPTIDSPAEIQLTENTLQVLTVNANDPDGDALSVSIAGGDDQSLFNIDGSGMLSFNTAPDFENPSDSEVNNIYRLTIEASDGYLSVEHSLSIAIQDAVDLANLNVTATLENLADSQVLPEGALQAYLTVDAGNKQPMTMAGLSASTNWVNIVPREHSVKVQFEFTASSESQAAIVAEQQQSVTLTEGDNTVILGDTGYVFPDDDNDSITNLEELLRGSNPNESNRQPTIGSPDAIQLAENITQVVSVSAIDPDGDELSFSIIGGDDQALFGMSDLGVLSFNVAPDFEIPADSDSKNTYRVTVKASDGYLAAEQTITVMVTDVVTVVEVDAPLPTDAAIVPANMQAYVRVNNGERRGMNLDVAGGSASVSLSDLISNEAYTFTLEVDYQHDIHGVVSVASATHAPLQLQDGINAVNFTTENYEYPNNDTDQLTNLQEIIVGSNPLIDDLTFTVGADPLSKEVILSWENPFTDQFNIYVSADENCDINNYSACAQGALYSAVTSPVTINSLSNGTAYYFQVESIYNSGIRAVVPQVSARPNRLVFNGNVDAIATDEAGNVYLGGDFTRVGAAMGSWVPINKLNGKVSNGTFPIVVGAVYTSAPDGEGGWYIGGNFTHVDKFARNNLAHILADGQVDPNWNPDANSTVLTLAVSGDTVYAGGGFTSVGGQSRNRLAALASDGSVLAWNPDADGSVNTLAVSGDTVYAGGGFTTVGGQSRNYMAALASDGSVLAWNPDANGRVRTLAVSGDTVYAGGLFTTVGGQSRNYMAALASDGSVLAWNPDADREVNTLAVSGDTVYAGGWFTSVGGQFRFRLAALASDGNVLAWNPDANGRVLTLAVSGDTVYAGGEFTTVGGQSRNYMAALASDGSVLAWHPDANDRVLTLAVSGDTVYAGGLFTTVGGQSRNYMAALASDGSVLAWNPDANREVNTLAVSGDTVYAGGAFTTVGGQSRKRLAALASDGSVLAWNPDANSVVNTLAVSGDTVYAGGGFTTVGGQSRNYMAALASDGSVLAWNPDANSSVNTLAVSGDTVYVGGAFTTVGGQSRKRLAALASDDSVLAWNPDANDWVLTLVVSGDTVYAGGWFTSVGGQSRNYMAALASDGSVLAWNPDANNRVLTLAVSGDTVFAGGTFTTVGGQSRNRLAALASDGSLLAWNPDANGLVWTLAVSGDTVYVGGDFSKVGGQVQQGFGRLGLDGILLP